HRELVVDADVQVVRRLDRRSRAPAALACGDERASGVSPRRRGAVRVARARGRFEGRGGVREGRRDDRPALSRVEPTIRYVRSADGTRLATWTFGSGPPLVWVAAPAFGTVETLWEVPDARRGLELLAARRTVVAYDHRGFGLSDHDVTDFSFDAVSRDLD